MRYKENVRKRKAEGQQEDPAQKAASELDSCA